MNAWRRMTETRLVRLAVRFIATSAISTVPSQVTFLLLLRGLDTSTLTASAGGAVAGAVPNFWLSRHWIWREGDRRAVHREAAGHFAVTAVSALIAIGVTVAADHVLAVSHQNARAILLSVINQTTYAVLAIVRFFVFDRFVFIRTPHPRRPMTHGHHYARD